MLVRCAETSMEQCFAQYDRAGRNLQSASDDGFQTTLPISEMS